MLLRKTLLLFVLLLLVAVPARAQVEGQVSLESLGVALWPEYDRPAMLVIYHITLAPDVPLPVEVAFSIPAAVGEPNAVAERDINGQLYNVAYEREVRGEWAVIRYIATVAESQLEYYDPGLQKEGNKRHYEFRWLGDYPVSNLSIQVQEPAQATNFQITPGLGAGTPAEDGLLYHFAEVGSYGAGETFDLTIDYERDTDALTVEMIEILQVQPSEPLTQDTAGRVNLLDYVPWVLAALGLILIASSVVWYWQGARKSAQRQAPQRGRRRVRTPEYMETEVEEGIYCHQCGKRAEPGDRFCRVCGTRLRTE